MVAPAAPSRHGSTNRPAASSRGGTDWCPERTVFIEQSPAAIEAGAFHNDVVAVANERILFVHEQAFADPAASYAAIRGAFPMLELVEVPADAVSLNDAIATYLFNAQLATLPGGTAALIVPEECRENAAVWAWLERTLAGNGPIRDIIPVDVRQSMANGGGPACLRLRVVADPATVDPRFLLNDAAAETIGNVVVDHWPSSIEPEQVGDAALAETVMQARMKLLEALDLAELIAPQN